MIIDVRGKVWFWSLSLDMRLFVLVRCNIYFFLLFLDLEILGKMWILIEKCKCFRKLFNIFIEFVNYKGY